MFGQPSPFPASPVASHVRSFSPDLRPPPRPGFNLVIADPSCLQTASTAAYRLAQVLGGTHFSRSFHGLEPLEHRPFKDKDDLCSRGGVCGSSLAAASKSLALVPFREWSGERPPFIQDDGRACASLPRSSHCVVALKRVCALVTALRVLQLCSMLRVAVVWMAECAVVDENARDMWVVTDSEESATNLERSFNTRNFLVDVTRGFVWPGSEEEGTTLRRLVWALQHDKGCRIGDAPAQPLLVSAKKMGWFDTFALLWDPSRPRGPAGLTNNPPLIQIPAIAMSAPSPHHNAVASSLLKIEDNCKIKVNDKDAPDSSDSLSSA